MKLFIVFIVCLGVVSASFSEVEYGNLTGLEKITIAEGDVFTMLANNLTSSSALLQVKVNNRTYYTSGKTICGPCVISFNKSGCFCSYQLIKSAADHVQVVTSPMAEAK